jgi:hypothetical protein
VPAAARRSIAYKVARPSGVRSWICRLCRL